jgi:hypothetical protein
LSTWVIDATGDKAAHGYWIGFAAVYGLASVFMM